MPSDKAKSILQLKIEKKIQHILLDMLTKSEMSLNDETFFISVNNVDISPDLRNLKIFIDISNMDIKNKQKVVKEFNNKYIYTVKDLIAKKINLRYVPEIIFYLDDTNEKIAQIEEIINKEKQKYKKEQSKNKNN